MLTKTGVLALSKPAPRVAVASNQKVSVVVAYVASNAAAIATPRAELEGHLASPR